MRVLFNMKKNNEKKKSGNMNEVCHFVQKLYWCYL